MKKFNGRTMGTYWQVTLAEPVNPKDETTLFSGIEMVLEMINQRMSNFIPTSEIELFGKHRSTEAFRVSHEMREVVAKALSICEETDGIYDITVAPLVNIWGFGPDQIREYPNQSDIDAARQIIGYRKIKIVDGCLIKDDPALRLNLCSIAKGYGVDKVAHFLESLGFHHYLVDIGGETRMSGSKAGEHWKVGIERPQNMGGALEQVITVKDVCLSVATSGNYRNYSAINGEYAVHEINPKTGYSQTSHLLSATVFAENCMTADGYATALMLLGDEQAEQFAEAHHIAALLIYSDDGRNCVTKATSAFTELMN